MNRQVNYIIYAILLSLSLPIGYYFIDKIAATEITKENPSANRDESKETKPVSVNKSVYLGKSLFNSKCASCHQIFKNSTGPALMNLEDRGPWAERSNLYAWIKNPAVFMKTDKYTSDLKKTYALTMQSFSDITNEEIDAVVDYINSQTYSKQVPLQ